MGTPQRIRVFVVEGQKDVRRRVVSTLSDVLSVEVCGFAGDAFEARVRLRTAQPDVVVLGFELPGVDGVTFLKHLLRMDPRPVVMLATEKHAQATITALELGAAGFLERTSPLDVRALVELLHRAARRPAQEGEPFLPRPTPRAVSCLGAPATRFSTFDAGHEVARLVHVARGLPEHEAAVATTQLRGAFADALVERLQDVAAVDVQRAREGARIDEGQLWVVTGDQRLRVELRGRASFFAPGAGVVQLEVERSDPDSRRALI